MCNRCLNILGIYFYPHSNNTELITFDLITFLSHSNKPVPMSLYKNIPIGNNIRKWRELKGLKQKELAKEIDISETTLSKIENDKTEVSLSRLQKIAFCFKIKMTQLFFDPLDLLPPTDDL